MELEPVKKTPVKLPEKIYAVLTLFIMTRPLWKLMIVGSVDVQYLLVAGLYIVSLRLVLSQPGRFAWIGTRDKLLLFLICLVLISTAWSTQPSSTVKNIITLLGGTFFGLYLATRYTLREQMQVMLWMLGLMAVLSLIVIVVSPALGTQTAGGNRVWVGLYDHKNGLGRYMAIGAILSWIMIKNSKRKWLLRVFFILAVVMVLMTRSGTSLLGLLATLVLLPIFRVWRWRHARALPGIVILGLLSTSIAVVFLTKLEYSGLDWFFVAIGRKPEHNTLQVRVALWDVVFQKAQQRPWLGYGYGNSSVYEALDSVALSGSEWLPEQAHNGFLEIFMQLGVVGLAAMLYHVTLNFHRGIKLARMTRSNESVWVLAFLILLLIFNLTYSVYLGQLTVPWTIYVALTLSVFFQLSRINAATANHAIDKSASI
jgi:O-antigen ligase